MAVKLLEKALGKKKKATKKAKHVKISSISMKKTLAHATKKAEVKSLSKISMKKTLKRTGKKEKVLVKALTKIYSKGKSATQTI